MTAKLVPIQAGIMPLVDCALLVAAFELGFAREEGIDLKLYKETSWATLRDRVAFKQLDVAQMLAPIPIASTLGLGHHAVPMIAPMALGVGGNGFTVSAGLWRALQGQGREAGGDPAALGAALKALLAARTKAGNKPLTFAVVHPFSAHNYELRYWLGAACIEPDKDVNIVVVPPFLMAEALKAGEVDAICVGEPWNTVAVEEGGGVLLLTKADIWRQSPEKVLGMRQDFYEAQPETIEALVRALAKASLWCGLPENASDLASILAKPTYADQPQEWILRSLTGEMVREKGKVATPLADMLHFSKQAATFPWVSHGLWFYSQMVRWGHVAFTDEYTRKIRECYRPDIYRKSLKGLEGIFLPAASSKVEGALTEAAHVGSKPSGLVLGPDGFFDGVAFDPDKIEAYLGSLSVKNHQTG